MASKFLPWIDDDKVSAASLVLTANWPTDTQRQVGFKPNEPSSASRVNSALRGSTAFVAAFMNLVDPGGSLNYTATVAQIQTMISNKVNFNLKNLVDIDSNSVKSLDALTSNSFLPATQTSVILGKQNNVNIYSTPTTQTATNVILGAYNDTNSSCYMLGEGLRLNSDVDMNNKIVLLGTYNAPVIDDAILVVGCGVSSDKRKTFLTLTYDETLEKVNANITCDYFNVNVSGTRTIYSDDDVLCSDSNAVTSIDVGGYERVLVRENIRNRVYAYVVTLAIEALTDDSSFANVMFTVYSTSDTLTQNIIASSSVLTMYPASGYYVQKSDFTNWKYGSATHVNMLTSGRIQAVFHTCVDRLVNDEPSNITFYLNRNGSNVTTGNSWSVYANHMTVTISNAVDIFNHTV